MGLELIVVLFSPRLCCAACSGFAVGSIPLAVVCEAKCSVLPIVVIGLEVFVEAGGGPFAWSVAFEQSLGYRWWEDPLVAQGAEDHVTGVCLGI